MGLEGRIKIYGNNILLRGAVINYDTIENTGIDHTLVIEGNITNYGAIIDGENHLITDIQGNAVNEGGWDNHEIRLSGSTDKQLLFRNDSLVGAPVRLASGLYGSPFQWYKNDVPVPGAGSPDLYLSGVGPGDFGVYHCTSQYGISANFTINRAVAAQFAVSDTAGCLPLTVQFTEMSASPGQINNRLWDFGDGESSAEENPVHTYTTKGIYGVSLTVCDASGCDSVRVENLIDVGFTPLADFTFENEISGNPVHFTDRSLGADSVILSFTDWADTVLAFSSRYTPPPPYPEWWWSEEQVLGEPDVYPLYGDYHEAWAPLTACGQREFIVVGFDEPRRINRVMIYETLHPGAIDTVYVLPDSGGMVAVWEGTAEPLALAAREFIVDFELTSFGVAGVRIAMNTEAVPYWNEIDAVAVSGPADTVFSPEIHYLWETGENGITYATSGDIAHTYGSAGRFDASLTVDYKNICFSTKEKTVTVYETGTLGLDFRAFLEGPFESGSMASGLSDALPLSHPYSAAPWHHQGDEEVSGMPSQEIVDWILVELRKSSGPPCSAVPDSTVCKSACFIDQEGRLRGSDGLTPPRVFLTEENNLYAVIYHRNHLPVMSAVHIQKTGNDFIFDFTADPLNIFGGENACKQVAPGTWALAGADGNADGQVNNGDKNDVWIPSAGLQGYHAADYNLDGQVNNGDKNDVWIPNTGLGGQVPE
ncbi:MAG: PKD domain-containing protein [Bacteroidales bacterium]|nr:PKD domain-containing protein [Bacteroidales bacterium]